MEYQYSGQPSSETATPRRTSIHVSLLLMAIDTRASGLPKSRCDIRNKGLIVFAPLIRVLSKPHTFLRIYNIHETPAHFTSVYLPSPIYGAPLHLGTSKVKS